MPLDNFDRDDVPELVDGLISLPVNATDIVSVLSLDICKFRLPISHRPRIRLIIFRQVDATLPIETLFSETFELPTSEEPIDIRIAFLPLDGAPRGVILSDDPKIVFDVLVASGNSSLEGVFVIDNLLPSIPRELRTWTTFPRPECRRLSRGDTVCLLAVQSRDSNGTDSMDAFPLARVDASVACDDVG